MSERTHGGCGRVAARSRCPARRSLGRQRSAASGFRGWICGAREDGGALQLFLRRPGGCGRPRSSAPPLRARPAPIRHSLKRKIGDVGQQAARVARTASGHAIAALPRRRVVPHRALPDLQLIPHRSRSDRQKRIKTAVENPQDSFALWVALDRPPHRRAPHEAGGLGIALGRVRWRRALWWGVVRRRLAPRNNRRCHGRHAGVDRDGLPHGSGWLRNTGGLVGAAEPPRLRSSPQPNGNPSRNGKATAGVPVQRPFHRGSVTKVPSRSLRDSQPS
jgi:hypothetical protein